MCFCRLTPIQLTDGVLTGQLLSAVTGLEQSYTNLERLINSGLPFGECTACSEEFCFAYEGVCDS